MSPIIYGDGRQSRDYTYIDDAIKVYDLVLNHDEPIVEPINFGSGREVSILDLASMVIDLCDKRGMIKPVHVEPRIGEVQKLIANASKAKQLLGWQPEYGFDEGLKEFVQWYKKYGMEGRMTIE